MINGEESCTDYCLDQLVNAKGGCSGAVPVYKTNNVFAVDTDMTNLTWDGRPHTTLVTFDGQLCRLTPLVSQISTLTISLEA